MSERVTGRDLDRQLEACASALANLCPPGARIVIEHGSRTNGRAYRIFYIPAGESGHHSIPDWPFDRGYMGWTAREAADALRLFIAGMFAAWRTS